MEQYQNDTSAKSFAMTPPTRLMHCDRKRLGCVVDTLDVQDVVREPNVLFETHQPYDVSSIGST